MKVIVTGSSGGIGKAVSNRFISLGHFVYGFDIKPSAINNTLFLFA